jgi:hypothetical protein
MTGNTTIDMLLALISAAAPGIILGIWAILKAAAAHSAARWDDEAVALVEKIAGGVIDKQKLSLTGVDH